MEALKALLNDFDPSVLLPDLEKLSGQLTWILRIALLAAPLILLGMGLLYYLAVQKNTDYFVGFRCRRGMASEEAWKFTQRLAGLVWSGLGLVLTIIMIVLSIRFGSMETDAMATMAVHCLLWELGLVVVSVLGIRITVMVLFDRQGQRRNFEKPAKTDESN